MLAQVFLDGRTEVSLALLSDRLETGFPVAIECRSSRIRVEKVKHSCNDVTCRAIVVGYCLRRTQIGARRAYEGESQQLQSDRLSKVKNTRQNFRDNSCAFIDEIGKGRRSKTGIECAGLLKRRSGCTLAQFFGHAAELVYDDKGFALVSQPLDRDVSIRHCARHRHVIGKLRRVNQPPGAVGTRRIWRR